MIELLHIPGNIPPQINQTVAANVISLIKQEGVVKLASPALASLQDQHEPLAVYLDILSMDLNEAAEESWPAQTLQCSAALAMMAYSQTEFTQIVDTRAFKIGHFIAEMNGVPDTYVECLPEDPGLFDIARAAAQDSIFDESHFPLSMKGGYEQVISIGAGLVRHYKQQALDPA